MAFPAHNKLFLYPIIAKSLKDHAKKSHIFDARIEFSKVHLRGVKVRICCYLTSSAVGKRLLRGASGGRQEAIERRLRRSARGY